MGKCAYQAVGPVLAAERHLLARRELQAAVGAEVNQRICPEAVLRPQVRSNVAVGRGCVCPVYDLERVAARSCRGLRKQHYVAELQAGDA